MGDSEGQQISEQDLSPLEQAAVKGIHDWLLANIDAKWEIWRPGVEQCSHRDLLSILKPLERPQEETSYIAERYCVFCRNDLPESETPGSPPNSSSFFDWELDVVGLFNLVPDSFLYPQVYVFRTNLADFSFVYDPPLILKNRQGNIKAVRADRRATWHNRCDVNRPLLFAHVCYWKVARQLHSNCSCLEFYRLMRQLHPVLPRTRLAKEAPWNLASFRDLGPTTNLNSLLSRSAGLPQELQRLMLQSIPPNSLVFCLLAAFQSASLLSELNYQVSTPVFSLKGLVPESFIGTGWLYATCISIFGRTYLRRIRMSSCQDKSRAYGLEINVKSLQCLRFVVGSLGISAIRLVYRNGSLSDWLGDPGNGWHGSILSFHISDLQILQDDLKVLSLRSPTSTSESLIASPSRALWDVVPGQSVQGDSHIAQMHPSSGQLTHYPGWRLCRYLPFQYDDQLAKDITVYSDFNGTNQILVHGKHYEFRAAAYPIGYQIETRTKKNLRRSAFFGPISLLFNPGIEWLSLIPAQVNGTRCAVRGLIVDLLTATDLHLNTIGAHTIPDEKPIANKKRGNQSSVPLQPFVIPAFGTAPRFLSTNPLASHTTAKLSNVKRLGMQKRDVTDFEGTRRTRCSGLCIYHNDGSIETLGQWDGSLTMNSTIIYNAEVDGIIDALIFQYGRGKMWDEQTETRHYIVDIRVKTSQYVSVEEHQEEGYHEKCPLDKPAFHWQASEQELIAWWFTPWYDDVGLWDSAMVEYHPSRQSECEYLRIE
ncbi:hypothetical protein PT974_01889 [Cladobotryum mycophilum]|uniref:Uncharacterized protein n=1 Tax=Cladobotryum mycophilum TaxID=491253 RepID=A0ABR0SWL2_9HYPO